MKTDLTTSIIAAVIGTIIAYFVCNLLIPKIDDFTYSTISTEVDYTLTDPNIEVFNYRAVNPTVEIYVGQCDGDNCESTVIIDLPEEKETIVENEEVVPEEESGTSKEPENGTTD